MGNTAVLLLAASFPVVFFTFYHLIWGYPDLWGRAIYQCLSCQSGFEFLLEIQEELFLGLGVYLFLVYLIIIRTVKKS